MIPKRVRFEVFKRDGFTCQYCGRQPPTVTLEADHIVPEANGGATTLENLTTSCRDCNRGKAAVPLGAVAPARDEAAHLAALQAMAERRSAIEAEIAISRQVREVEAKVLALLEAAWKEETGCSEGFQRRSALRFLERGIGLNQFLEAIRSAGRFSETAHPSERWRYCCGGCWQMIRSLENSNAT